MKRIVLVFLLCCMTTSALALENGIYRDQADGFGGKVIVTAIIREGKFVEITTENTGGEKSEYYLKAEEAIIPALIEKQQVDGVDTVAGATGTSNSILQAMRGIMEQAYYTGKTPSI